MRDHPESEDHVRAAITAGADEAHAADVVLAWAVGRGDAGAVARFDAMVEGDVAAAARKIDRDPGFVDEVRQRVRVRLVVGDGDAPPRIASYRGTGPLRAWVGIAAQRVALNLHRDRKPTAGDDVLAELADRDPDPEVRHLKTLYRAEYKEALDAALAGLPDRQRALLRLRYVEALELSQIGALYGVHESTASRWIAAATRAVSDATRDALVARLGLGASTIDSVARMVASQLDLSIARLLR
jgi:RNA polymerase sigma-70 factor (ECF subfamily)